MKTINLRVLYPEYYTKDEFITIPDHIESELRRFTQQDTAYRIRTYRHKAYYSLDRNDGIENDIVFVAASPEELYERKLTNEQLYAAINSLPEKQAKRIYAYYFLNMDEPSIARADGVSQQAIHTSIKKGLKHIEKYLKEFL